ncbi:hypothetical protein CWI82_00740 [Pseudidiomarina tainanensis]|jgi:hypothetical protein|uniref:Uncharacterized protein n=2 Tax=Pseudidiomarina TaxID=2800384 RepID=A0A1I6HLG2_9GAMM|nr:MULTISPECIES: hypothetical protein [Pseudidiomarina]RZQ55876.1 hypothetical protein CWI82_00740 [Pseudidiomarina tainanensis]SFR55292.1 hypothetical protein SAMN04488070_1916 [Pseudidiomarina maritima]
MMLVTDEYLTKRGPMEIESMKLTKDELRQLEEFERRRIALNQSEWWDRLSMDQKFGVYQLQKFGFDLAFIRNTEDGPTAVVRRGSEFATVNHEGDVDLSPDIVLRD